MKRSSKTIAFMLTLSLLASSGCNIVRETETTTTAPETTATVTEATTTTTKEEPTTTTTTEATTTTTTEESTTTTDKDKSSDSGFVPDKLVSKKLPSDGIPDKISGKENDIYYALMSKIDEIEKAYPGTTYGFVEEYIDEAKDLCWVLATNNKETGKVCYCADGSSVMEVKSNTILPEKMLDYKTARSLPFIFQITDGDLYVGDKVEDGYYFGNDIAYSKDGKYLLFYYGKGAYIKKEDAKKLKSGERVTFAGSGVTLMVDEGTEGVDATFDEECYWLSEDYLPDDMKGSYYLLMMSNDNPGYFNEKVALLPIPQKVKMSDTFKILYGDRLEDYAKSYKKTGNVFLDSDYYISNTFLNEYASENNGFISGEAFLYPIIIKDGKIANMNLEWR
ncbi:MAG: hypothetical protein J5657_04375 [Clostridiales bacterium]|nr:hypothetical protein [Clostridiales bacterium]